MSESLRLHRRNRSRSKSISQQFQNMKDLNGPGFHGFSKLGSTEKVINTDNVKVSKDALSSKENNELEPETVTDSDTSSSNESFLSKPKKLMSIFLIILEYLISSITFVLPDFLISFFTNLMKFLFSFLKSNNKIYNDFLKNDENLINADQILKKVEQLRNFKNFHEICSINGFKSESHIVHTVDGFKLTLHRINPEDNGYKPNGKVIYLQHGLLMTSDVWCVMMNKDENLPFRLCELGYDVFLGNNRGNKYSNKHQNYSANDLKFWDFSIDEFAMYDIPSSIDYICYLKKCKNIIYIGFSQGCSQILSSISINHDLNEKIEKLVLIAPATTPKKLSNWLINSIINFKPSLMYKLFGRKILMKSVMFWKRITYPPMFIKLIDIPNDVLFNWKSENIDIIQKLVSYYHLYSTTSVKCVVHWFQIIKSKNFQMYQEKDYFESFHYPTQNIKINKLMIIYGMNDSLVDIDILVNQLPPFEIKTLAKLSKFGVFINKIYLSDDGEEMNTLINSNNVDREEEGEKSALAEDSELRIFGIENHEHLDLLWGRSIEANVIKNVIEFIN